MAALVACSPPPNQPVLEVDAEFHDFGEVYLGETREHRFQLHNGGAQDLVIHDTRSSCGCAVVELSQSTIGPGETAELVTKVNVDRAQPNLEKTIRVFSNDPDQREMLLRFRLGVKELYQLDPEQLDFGHLVVGAEETRSLVLRPLESCEITGFSDQPGIAAVTWEKVGGTDPAEFEVAVTLRGDLSIGAHALQAEVLTDHSRQSRATIPLRVLIRPDVEVKPEDRLAFGALKSAEGGERKVSLSARGTTHKLILDRVDLVCSLNRGRDPESGQPVEFMTASTVSDESQRHHEVTVKVRPGAPAGPLFGRLDLRVRTERGGAAVYTLVLNGEVLE